MRSNGLPEGRFRLGVAPLPVERHAQTTPEGGAVRPEVEGLAIGGLRLGVPALTPEPQREVGPRLHRARPQADGLAQGRLGLRVLAVPAQRHPQFVVKLGVVRAEVDRRPERLDRVGIVAEAPQGEPALGVEVGVLRAQAGGIGVDRRLLAPAPQPPQGRGQRDVGRDVVRLMADRFPERRDRLLEPPLALEDQPELVVRPGDWWAPDTSPDGRPRPPRRGGCAS